VSSGVPPVSDTVSSHAPDPIHAAWRRLLRAVLSDTPAAMNRSAIYRRRTARLLAKKR
jgi:hypothetical protein